MLQALTKRLDEVYIANWNGRRALTPRTRATKDGAISLQNLVLWLNHAMTLPQQDGEYVH